MNTSTFVADKIIRDMDSGDDCSKYVVYDMIKLINTPVTRGDVVLIPTNLRKDTINFWEAGGRNPNVFISTANLIATEHDTIPDAILFNKLNKNPNGKHALVSIFPGYRLYVGRIHVRNMLAPKIKIIRLIYRNINNDYGDKTVSNCDSVTYGEFVVDDIFTSYHEISDCKPAARLLAKLFNTKVMRPYFANGWSVSNIRGIGDHEKLKQEYIRLSGELIDIEHFTIAEDFIDKIEDTIVEMNNPKLSSALQVLDFNSGLVTMRPLKGLSLSDISDTMQTATSAGGFSIFIDDLIQGFNPKLLFNNTDKDILEVALSHDISHGGEFAINLGHRVFGVLRGFKG